MKPETRNSKLPLPPGPRPLLPLRLFANLRKDPLAFLTHLTQTYGDISSFRALGTTYIVINHPDLAKDVLLTYADAFFKGPALQNSKHLLGDGLLTAEGDTHKSQRRLMTPAFHAQHVQSYAPAIDACTQRTIHELTAAPQPTDIHAAMTRLTLRIAVTTLFGFPPSALADADTTTVGNAMHTLMANYSRTVVPWGKLLNALPLPSTKKIQKARTDLFTIVDRLITQRRKEFQTSDFSLQPSLLSTLIQATDTECPHATKKTVHLSDAQLRDQAITLLTAGHETTANALTFTLYLLAANPHIQSQLAANPDPTAKDALLHNIIAESLRLYPPAWTLGRQPQRDLTLASFRIPKKSTLLIPQWTLHRDPRFFPDPLTFTPDRWLSPTHPRFAYLPFSTGPRNCIGESFAWQELHQALSLLLKTFTFTLTTQTPPPLQPAITLRPAKKILLTLTPTSPRPPKNM